MKNWFELIENYINNQATDQERKQVEHLLSTTPEFAKQFQLQLDVNKALSEKDVMALRKTLNEVFKNYKKDTGTTIRKLYTKNWHIAAASVTILILLGNVLLSDILSNNSNDDLFNKYYQTESSIMVTRSSETTSDDNLRTALHLYSNDQYDKAITIFKGNQDNVIAKFYLGLSYIETNKFEVAAKAFQDVIDHSDNLFIEQAQWYRALCLLKSDKIEEAIPAFAEIQNSSSLFKDQAKDILASIE